MQSSANVPDDARKHKADLTNPNGRLCASSPNHDRQHQREIETLDVRNLRSQPAQAPASRPPQRKRSKLGERFRRHRLAADGAELGEGGR